MDKLAIACNIAAESAITLDHTPLVLYEVCSECRRLLAIVHKRIIIAHGIAGLIGPLFKVVAGIGRSRHSHSLSVGYRKFA